jgi:hypothetical protein
MKNQSRVRRSILLEDTREAINCGGDPSPQFVGRRRAFLSQPVTHDSHDPSATSPREYRQQDVCDGSGVVRFFPAAPFIFGPGTRVLTHRRLGGRSSE